MAMTIEPCPFCGGEPQVRIPTERDGFAAHVMCRCGAQLYGHKRHFASEQEAVEAWNRRAHHAEIAAAVRSLQRVKAMRDEWERDVQEHLCRFGQPLPASVECLIEKLDTAMRAGEGAG
jgi:Lar family restriction alleviation protein